MGGGGEWFFKVEGGGGEAFLKLSGGGGKGILKLEKIIPEHDFSSSIAWSLINTNFNFVFELFLHSLSYD